MIRLVFFVALGILLGGGIVKFVGPPGAGTWVLPVGLSLAIISATLFFISRTTRHLSVPPPELVERAISAGRTGLARIDTVRQTGTQINDQPICELELTVQPRHGSAYRTRVTKIVGLVDLARYVTGSTHRVAILTEDTPDIALLDPAGPADGHSADAGTSDPRLGDLRIPPAEAAGPLRIPEPGGLKADGSRVRPIISQNRRTRPVRVLAFLAITVVTAAIVVYPYRVGAQQSFDAVVAGGWRTGDLHADLRTPENLKAALATVREEAGVFNAVSVVVMPDLITFDLPVSDGSQETDSWIYRGGVLEHEGAAITQPENERVQFPLDDVAWDRLLPAAEEAIDMADIETAGIEALDEVSYHVSRSTIDDVEDEDFGTFVGPVDVRFSFADAYHSWFFELDADGTNLTMTSSG